MSRLLRTSLALACRPTGRPECNCTTRGCAGAGPRPQSGQQVTFNYIAFNESGRVIDSSYRQGQPGQTRLGNGVLIVSSLGLRRTHTHYG